MAPKSDCVGGYTSVRIGTFAVFFAAQTDKKFS